MAIIIVNNIFSPFVCNLNKGGGGIGGYLNFKETICIDPRTYPQGRPATISYFGLVTYSYISTNSQGFWRYKLQTNAKNNNRTREDLIYPK